MTLKRQETKLQDTLLWLENKILIIKKAPRRLGAFIFYKVLILFLGLHNAILRDNIMLFLRIT